MIDPYKYADLIAQELDKRDVHYYEIGLFGSRATGEASPTSDWDFYAWVDRETYEKGRNIEIEIAYAVSPESPSSIKCLFGKDKSMCIDFKFTPKRPLTGKPIISKTNWRYFVDNVRKYDLKWIEGEDKVSEKEKELIWRDIQEHKKLSLEFARKEGAEKEAMKEWDKIEKEFYELTKNK